MTTTTRRLYDLNVFNRGAYYSEDLPEAERYTEWALLPYELTGEGAGGYGTGKEREDLNITLTEAEVEAMGLTTVEGGVDNDYWIESQSFIDNLPGTVPSRVQDWFDALPEYTFNPKA